MANAKISSSPVPDLFSVAPGTATRPYPTPYNPAHLRDRDAAILRVPQILYSQQGVPNPVCPRMHPAADILT